MVRRTEFQLYIFVWWWKWRLPCAYSTYITYVYSPFSPTCMLTTCIRFTYVYVRTYVGTYLRTPCKSNHKYASKHARLGLAGALFCEWRKRRGKEKYFRSFVLLNFVLSHYIHINIQRKVRGTVTSCIDHVVYVIYASCQAKITLGILNLHVKAGQCSCPFHHYTVSSNHGLL